MAIQQPGMFGLAGVGQNQEDLVAKIRAEQQQRNQTMTQNLGKYAGLAQSGMESAQQFGGALGVQDPRLQRNSKVIEARDAVRAKGITDPEEQLQAMAQELASRGLYDEADRVMQRLQEAQKAKRTEARDEARLGLEKQRVGLEERRINLQLEQEKRAGKLTDAQINEINARIANLDKDKYSFQISKDAAGNIVEVVGINKTNPSDVVRTPVTPQTGATATGTKPQLTEEQRRAAWNQSQGRTGTTPASPQAQPAQVQQSTAPRSQDEVNAFISAASRGDTRAKAYLQQLLQEGNLSVGQRQRVEAAIRGQ